MTAFSAPKPANAPDDGAFDVGIDERPLGRSDWLGWALWPMIWLLWIAFLTRAQMSDFDTNVLVPLLDGDYDPAKYELLVSRCQVFGLVTALLLVFLLVFAINSAWQFRRDRLFLSGSADCLVLTSRNHLGQTRCKVILLHDLLSVHSRIDKSDEGTKRRLVVYCGSTVHELELSWVRTDEDLAATLTRLKDVLGLIPRSGEAK